MLAEINYFTSQLTHPVIYDGHSAYRSGNLYNFSKLRLMHAVIQKHFGPALYRSYAIALHPKVRIFPLNCLDCSHNRLKNTSLAQIYRQLKRSNNFGNFQRNSFLNT